MTRWNWIGRRRAASGVMTYESPAHVIQVSAPFPAPAVPLATFVWTVCDPKSDDTPGRSEPTDPDPPELELLRPSLDPSPVTILSTRAVDCLSAGRVFVSCYVSHR